MPSARAHGLMSMYAHTQHLLEMTNGLDNTSGMAVVFESPPHRIGLLQLEWTLAATVVSVTAGHLLQEDG